MPQGRVPEAPHVEGFPLPPAELAPGVPNDLDTLCTVTLGANDDGPHSPAELVRELEPWAEVRGHPEQVDATAPSAPFAADAPPVTGPVNRTSVRRDLGDPTAPPRPGTPPPA